jgi:hypothetical protein
MDTMIAFCGLTCSECPALLATQADNDTARERVAATWREMLNSPGLTAESINCDGCLAQTGRLFDYCQHCEIRACGLERGVTNCAHCPEYATCDKLAAFFEMAPEGKVTLDAIRTGL